MLFGLPGDLEMTLDDGIELWLVILMNSLGLEYLAQRQHGTVLSV